MSLKLSLLGLIALILYMSYGLKDVGSGIVYSKYMKPISRVNDPIKYDINLALRSVVIVLSGIACYGVIRLIRQQSKVAELKKLLDEQKFSDV